MLNPTEQLFGGLAALALIMLLLWLWQLRSGDAGIVDIGWSAGLGSLAVFYALTSDGEAIRRGLLALLGGLWGFRLAFYLYRRNQGRPEDGRYQSLRSSWGSRVQVFFFLFFQFQALLAVLFSLPFLVVAQHGGVLSSWDLVGALVLGGALVGESVADGQLNRFRSDPAHRGKTCRVGLWRYSRHPNYFFEWLQWWGYVLLAVGAEYWAVTLLGPVLMLVFLFKVTGIPATEKQALTSRGEDYRRYQQSTSVFVPWFPKEEGP